MTIKDAYHITRPFINGHREIIPTLSNHWKFYFFGFKDEIQLYSSPSNDTFGFFNYSKFKKLFKDIKLESALQEDNADISQKVIGNYAFTSIGLVSEEDFYLATDMMENLYKIKKKELTIGSRYKSIIGKEFIYLGDVHYHNNNSKHLIKDLLYDMNYSDRSRGTHSFEKRVYIGCGVSVL